MNGYYVCYKRMKVKDCMKMVSVHLVVQHFQSECRSFSGISLGDYSLLYVHVTEWVGASAYPICMHNDNYTLIWALCFARSSFWPAGFKTERFLLHLG